MFAHCEARLPYMNIRLTLKALIAAAAPTKCPQARSRAAPLAAHFAARGAQRPPLAACRGLANISNKQVGRVAVGGKGDAKQATTSKVREGQLARPPNRGLSLAGDRPRRFMPADSVFVLTAPSAFLACTRCPASGAAFHRAARRLAHLALACRRPRTRCRMPARRAAFRIASVRSPVPRPCANLRASPSAVASLGPGRVCASRGLSSSSRHVATL